MKLVRIAFAFVFLCGFGNALPDIGNCSFIEYFCKARRCTTVFYKALQKDPSANCSVKFQTMVECNRKVEKDCQIYEKKPSSLYYEERLFCVNGSVSIWPDGSPYELGFLVFRCTSTYFQKFPLCRKTFQDKFVANWSDPSLCSERAKERKCKRDLIESERCKFDPVLHEALNLTLGDYNPFCANNRDPGATGNDQCHGFLPGPTRSTTRPPTTPFLGQSTLPNEHSHGTKWKNKNKSDVISVKQYILLILLGMYIVLV
ncbi:hypothetical protein ACROYT_G034244 [Oculina patagonica]